VSDDRLLARIAVDPTICSGRPFIRGTRVCVTVILDALTQGLSPEEVIQHYPGLDAEDLQAAVAYARRLAEENGGIAVLRAKHFNGRFQPL
jgi:uncharacterized protein (DUF433 family)